MVQAVPVANMFLYTLFFCAGSIAAHLAFIEPKFVNGSLYKLPKLKVVDAGVLIVLPNKSVVSDASVLLTIGGNLLLFSLLKVPDMS